MPKPETLKLSEVENPVLAPYVKNGKEIHGATLVTCKYRGNPEYQFIATSREVEALSLAPLSLDSDPEKPGEND